MLPSKVQDTLGPSRGRLVRASIPGKYPIQIISCLVWKSLMDMAQTCETHQPAVENLDDVRGYSTRDLYEPHSTKKGLWRM